MTQTADYDVVVLGAGVAGMTAAVFAALRGMSALVVEKAATVGGTSALSAGTAWVPGTFHAAAVQPIDSREKAERYLNDVVGNRLDRAKLDAFLTYGPLAIAELHEKTVVQFRPRLHHPDYLSDREGASLRGRALEPLPFDGRTLGPALGRLRRPLAGLTLGGMMLSADDIKAMLAARRSPRAARHALGLIARHAADWLRYRRGSRLLMGNALCARLLHTLNALDVPIWTSTAVTRLTDEGGRVTGAIVQREGTAVAVRARAGVVLATGGFAHSKRLQQQLLPEPRSTRTAMPDEVSGDGIELAISLGGRLGESYGNGAFWSPISVHRRRDGSEKVYPHFFLDRGKPGVLAVNQAGRRFVNEATSYDAFVRAMYADADAVPCWLIADAAAVQKYGLGLALPGGYRVRRLLADGYLRQAGTIADLAKALGLDPVVLSATVARFNEHASAGADPDFARGERVANHVLGDPTRTPNPCLGPLGVGPYYAVQIEPGMNGTSTGLATDAQARVLGASGAPIPGLFACGNDMSSMMEGVYPGPGVTIGPAMVFAYIAVNQMTAE